MVEETKITKFLGLDIGSSLSWKNHIDQMMIRLSRACYAIRCIKHFMSQDTLRTIYFSYFHSILSYSIIFWGNSAYSSNIFKIQKRKIRIIMNITNRVSCHQLFKNLKILPLKSQYIFSLLSTFLRGVFRSRQTRQLPRAVDLKERLLSCQSY